MNFFMINPENLPEEIREQIEKQHDLHHMSHQQHIHEVNDFFRGLNKEQLTTLNTLVHHIIDGTAEDNERGAYYLGRISEHLMLRHGVCICGTDHDAEAKALLEKKDEEPATPQEITKNYTKSWVADANAPSMPRSKAIEVLEDKIGWLGDAEGWSETEIANAKKDARQMLDDLVYSKNAAAEPEPKVDSTDESITFTDHAGITHTWKNGEWVATPQDFPPTTPEPTGEPREALLKKYNVLDFPLQFPKVTCSKGCGKQWISLVDRMKRAPEKCDGCQQKSAWG